VFPKVVIMLDDMAQHFDFHIVVYSIPIFLKLKKSSMCGEYQNPNLQVLLSHLWIQQFWFSWSVFCNIILNNLSCKLSFGGINVLVVLSNIAGI